MGVQNVRVAGRWRRRRVCGGAARRGPGGKWDWPAAPSSWPKSPGG